MNPSLHGLVQFNILRRQSNLAEAGKVFQKSPRSQPDKEGTSNNDIVVLPPEIIPPAHLPLPTFETLAGGATAMNDK
jgi:hypothetical protein